jgi:phosphatidate phosphatase APP1
MQKMLKFSSVLILLYASFAQAAAIKSDESVILFNSSAHLNDENQWSIPLHGWIFEYDADSLWREAGVLALRKSLQLTHVEMNNELFKQRAWMFLVDNKRGKKIRVILHGKVFQCRPSRPNGHFVGEAKIPANALPAVKQPLWISYEVELKPGDHRRITGEFQLLPRKGLSVISDIDDTIKDSHVMDKSELLKNTFLERFRAVDGMAEVYKRWRSHGAAFHYLSASPWQLYSSLLEFISDNEFPKGDFYLRQFRIKDTSFYSLFASPYDYKVKVITEILRNYPERKFILVGDNTESDPEVYARITKLFPNSIIKILIRNASGHLDTKKMTQTFTGLDNSMWMVFSTAHELDNLVLGTVVQ